MGMRDRLRPLAPQPRNGSGTLTQIARRLGALAILGTGAVHLQQYIVQNFRGIPTIQVLFLLNVIGSGAVGCVLLLSLDRLLPDRWSNTALACVATVGLTIALGSLAALFISESEPLFGLQTARYSTAAVLAIVAEGAAVLFLAPLLASSARAWSRRHRPEHTPGGGAAARADHAATR